MPHTPVRFSDLSGASPLASLVFDRRKSKKKTTNTDVLINLRPVNTLAIIHQLETGPLLIGGVQQALEPYKRHRDPASVCEIHDQLIARGSNLRGEGSNSGRHESILLLCVAECLTSTSWAAPTLGRRVEDASPDTLLRDGRRPRC